MKILRLNQLPDIKEGHFLKDLVPGKFINAGGLTFPAPGNRAHTKEGPDGSDEHVHDIHEVFIILAGKATMELNGEMHPLCVGDVVIIEPGEDHHITSDTEDPSVHNWLRLGDTRRESQL